MKINRQQKRELERKIGFTILSNELYKGDDLNTNLELQNKIVFESCNSLIKNDIPFIPGEGTKINSTEEYMPIINAIGSLVQFKNGYSFFGWDNTNIVKSMYNMCIETILNYAKENKKNINIG